MSDAKNNNSIIKTTTSKRNRVMSIRRCREIALSALIVVIASCMLPGCGELSELYILTNPVFPDGLNASEAGQLRAREIQRRQFQYDELRQNSLTHNDRDGITSLGIPLLTWRFGEGSSRPDLVKCYAIHQKNLLDSNTSNTEIVKVLSPDGGED